MILVLKGSYNLCQIRLAYKILQPLHPWWLTTFCNILQWPSIPNINKAFPPQTTPMQLTESHSDWLHIPSPPLIFLIHPNANQSPDHNPSASGRYGQRIALPNQSNTDLNQDLKAPTYPMLLNQPLILLPPVATFLCFYHKSTMANSSPQLAGGGCGTYGAQPPPWPIRHCR